MRWEVNGPIPEGEMLPEPQKFDDFAEFVKAVQHDLLHDYSAEHGGHVEVYDDARIAAHGFILWRKDVDGMYGKIMLVSHVAIMQAPPRLAKALQDFFFDSRRKLEQIFCESVGAPHAST